MQLSHWLFPTMYLVTWKTIIILHTDYLFTGQQLRNMHKYLAAAVPEMRFLLHLFAAICDRDLASYIKVLVEES